jgi:hypothetical protein
VTRLFLLAKVLLVAVAASLTLLYVADELALRYRLRRGAALEAVVVYPAALLKNGKLEIFRGQPEIEQCARSMFPHAGYNPCWWVRRHRVRPV